MFRYFRFATLSLRPQRQRPLPGRAGLNIAGTIIGAVSSLVGIGGGTLSVPFLTRCQVHLREAIGSAAAIGLPIAAAGTLGYIYQGWSAAGLPPQSLGFVYLPAFAAIVSSSILFAPLGARLTHRLPIVRLKRIFAATLYLVAIKIAFS